MQITDLIGFILPPIVEFINRRVYDHKQRYAIALAVSVAVALVTNYNDLLGVFTGLQYSNPDQILESSTKVFQSFLAIAVAAKTSYELWFKDSEIKDKIKYS